MNPILFDFGFVTIKWYSVFIVIALVISTIFIIREASKYGITKEYIINLIFWLVIMGIVGARLYYVLFNLDFYKENILDIFKVWNGGLAIHGAIIAGVLTIVFYAKKYKVNILRLIDIVAPWFLFSQALCRWGNFFNSEAYGNVTTLENLQNLNIPDFIINGMFINGNYYTPTFLYESIWCLLGFIVLMVIKRLKYTKIGTLTGVYLIWYSFGRFFIETLRMDSLMIGDFKVAQLISIILFVVGLIIISIQVKKPKLEELYNDQSLQEDIRF